MNKWIIALTIAITLSGFSSVFSQETISGLVTNKFSGDPVSGAIIKIENTSFSDVSDNDGRFSITFSNIKKVKLIVSHISYSTLSVNITNGIYKGLKIELTPTSQELKEVEVLGVYDEKVPYAVEILSQTQLDETNKTDIGNLLRGEPNVGGIRKGAVGIDPVIRGFKYSQVAVQLNDGTRIEGGCPNRMDPSASHVNINDLSSISLYKGPFALKYGPAFGGLVIMETYKPVFYDKFRSDVNLIIGGQTNYKGYRSGIRVNGGNNIISFNFSANRNKFGDYESGDGMVFSAASDNYNVTGGLGLRFGEKHTVTFQADRSWGRNIDFPTLPMDERCDDTRILNFSYNAVNLAESINFLKLAAYNSDVNHIMDNKNRPFSDTVVAISTIHAVNTGGRFAINFNSLGGVAETGLTYENTYKDGNRTKQMIMQPGLPKITESIWNDARIINAGVFTEYKITKGKFDLIGALRFDYNIATSGPMLRVSKGEVVYENDDTGSQYFNFSASAGFNWHFSEKSSFIFSLGKGTRSPDMTERYIILLPVGYDPYDYLGNPDLKPENNHELDLGIERYCERSGATDVNLFFSYVTDYIAAVVLPPSVVKPQTKGVLGVKQFTNIEKAYLTGFEFKHTTPAHNKWQIKLNAAFTMGMNPDAVKLVYEDGEVVGEESVKNDPLPEIPPFEANIWFSYKFFNSKLVPELHFRYAAKQAKISEAFNETETPSFNIFDFTLAYKYSSNLSVNLGVNNIFNLNYYEHLSRRIIGSKEPFYEPGRIFYANLVIKL